MGTSSSTAFKSPLDFDERLFAPCLEIIFEQKALLAIVKTALPGEIARRVLHCVHSGRRLLIYTESASWASQIRFFEESILNKIAESGQKNINGLQVRIGPDLRQPLPARHARLPSAENIGLLKNQLEGKENKDELTQALSRLATTLEKRLKA